MTATPTTSPRVPIGKLAPDANRAMVAFDRSIDLEPRLRELVKIRVSQINGCGFCLEMHTREARELGETEKRMHTLAGWRETPYFDEREQAALALAEVVTLIGNHHIPEDVYARAASVFSETELANLVWAIIAINSWNRAAILSGLMPPD
jgi:AhpD family alkylhydroperoxidase